MAASPTASRAKLGWDQARSEYGVAVGSFNFEDFKHALLDIFDGHSSMLVDKPLQWWQKAAAQPGTSVAAIVDTDRRAFWLLVNTFLISHF